MLQLTKKEVEFLSLYNFCSDTRSRYSDKFRISSIKDSTDVLFCQLNSKNMILATTLKNKNIEKEEFSFIFKTQEFYKMCNLCSDTDSITIKNEGINFGSGSIYKFESYEDLKDIYGDKKIDNFLTAKLQSIKISNFDIIKNIEFCIGMDDFDNIAILADKKNKVNHFVASDGTFITASIKNNMVDVKNDVYIDSIIYKIVKNSTKEVSEINLEINEEEKYYRYTLNNTNIIFPFVESKIFNIFDEDKVVFYDHKDCVSFKKVDFIKALERISVVTNNALKNRVFIHLGEDSITVENKDGIAGEEKISAKIDEELKNKYFIVPAHSILKAVKEISKEDIKIRIDSNIDEMNVAKVEADGDDKFFVIGVLEKV